MGMQDIIVRYPKLDYSELSYRWADNLPFCHDRNANAIIPSPVEPWLIKILQRVLPRVSEKNVALRAGIDGFIAQESQHFRQHRQYIKALVGLGYTRVPELEARLAAELDDLLKTRSLKFLLAYADGFESLGAVSGKIWFEQSDEMVGDHDNAAIRMWKWHIAEEFEHREVCFELFRALYCRNPITRITNGYFYRLYGLWFAMKHLGGFATEASRHMRQVDKARMTPEEKEQFYREMGEFKAFTKRTFLKPLMRNLLPWYNPARKKTPKGMWEYLRRFEADGEWSAKGARTASA